MKNQKREICTIVLVAANVIVFFVLAIMGNTEDGSFMLAHGAQFAPYITDGKEYYRLFTSMFLHFGFPHLMNNMLILFLLGRYLERELGCLKYIMLYLLSGLGGNLLSLAFDLKGQEYAVSAGASGAIFGIIGALFYIAIRNSGRIGDLSGRGLAFMIVLSLYYGYTSSGVDVQAHVGGLIAGFILSVLLYWKRDAGRRANSFS